mgnify:CR=1 FL=1
MEANNKAMAYAEKKSSEMIINAIKEAYIDGYNVGYKDRDSQLPPNYEDDGVEYVDLGLPSGTLWSSDSLRENGEIVYLPYDKAVRYNLPTKEQWEELDEYCRFERTNENLYLFRVIGPSGNYIEFNEDYWYIADVCKDGFRFWLNGEVEGNEAYSIIANRLYNNTNKLERNVRTIFKGYKLPVKLVK